MAVTISGTLRNASGVRPNTKIILTATRTSNTVLQHAPDISITTDANGDYSFNCNPTAYVLSIQQDGYRREVVGAIMVYSDSAPGTLEDFILAPKAPDLTPEIVKQVEELRNEAAQFASQAADSAQEAKGAAASIGNASIEHGSWDASSGDFPALDGKSNWYRISVGGTLTSSTQDDMPVMVDDMIYHSTVDSKWYKVDNQAGGPSSGDMRKAIYDPTGKNADTFDMDNMDEGNTAKILTQAERDAITANTVKRSYPEADEQKLASIGDGANLSDISAGSNISIDKTDPQNPTISTDSNLVDVIAGNNISINKDDPRNPVISTDSKLVDVTAGTNITIDKADPRNPIISSTASGSGDMEKSTYDPQNINADAFDRANHTGEQVISTVAGLQDALNGKLGVDANATSSSKLETARNITVNLTGDSTGQSYASFDGSSDVEITVDVSAGLEAVKKLSETGPVDIQKGTTATRPDVSQSPNRDKALFWFNGDTGYEGWNPVKSEWVVFGSGGSGGGVVDKLWETNGTDGKNNQTITFSQPSTNFDVIVLEGIIGGIYQSFEYHNWTAGRQYTVARPLNNTTINTFIYARFVTQAGFTIREGANNTSGDRLTAVYGIKY